MRRQSGFDEDICETGQALRTIAGVRRNHSDAGRAAIDANRKGGYNFGMAFLLSARPPFNLPVVVNSHGWVQLAPFSHDQGSDGFDYVMQMGSGRVIRRGGDLCYERSWSLC